MLSLARVTDRSQRIANPGFSGQNPVPVRVVVPLAALLSLGVVGGAFAEHGNAETRANARMEVVVRSVPNDAMVEENDGIGSKPLDADLGFVGFFDVVCE